MRHLHIEQVYDPAEIVRLAATGRLTHRRVIEMADPGMTLFSHAVMDAWAFMDVAEQGLIPASELRPEQRHYSGEHASRPGCVYLGAPSYVENVIGNEPPILVVDLADLDPDLLSCDEDLVAIHSWGDVQDTHIDVAYFLPHAFARENGETRWIEGGTISTRPPAQGECSLGEWAATQARLLDRADAVAFAIQQGSIAYRGQISPELIALDQERIYGWTIGALRELNEDELPRLYGALMSFPMHAQTRSDIDHLFALDGMSQPELDRIHTQVATRRCAREERIAA
jgi:hypothetical protein